MRGEEPNRIATALESIAKSLEKIANPPLVAPKTAENFDKQLYPCKFCKQTFGVCIGRS